MHRLSEMLVFFSVVLLSIGGANYFLWLRLVRDPQLAGPWRQAATIFLLTMSVLLPALIPLTRLLPGNIARLILFFPYWWMGTMFFLFLVLLTGELVTLSGCLIGKASGASHHFVIDEKSKLILTRAWAITAVAIALLASFWGMFNALGRRQIKQVDVAIADLPAGLEGLTIAQLSDLHLGAPLGQTWFEQVVKQVNELSPAIIVITGDLVDGTVKQLRQEVEPVARLRAPHGVFMVTGNHEYYSGVKPWLAELPRLGIKVLSNQSETIEHNGANFDLIGVNDFSAGRMGDEFRPNLEVAIGFQPKTNPRILLAHQPRHVDEAVRHRVDLMLAGHTHGGQIWPWHYLVYLQQPMRAGLYRREQTQVYVSEGTGFWGPPMRLGTSSEITLITLRKL